MSRATSWSLPMGPTPRRAQAGELAWQVGRHHVARLAIHYQLAEIAQVKDIDFATISDGSMLTCEAVAKAIGRQGRCRDLAVACVRSLLAAARRCRLVFGSASSNRRAVRLGQSDQCAPRGGRTKFVRAYRRGVADYAAALLRYDRFANASSDQKIARGGRRSSRAMSIPGIRPAGQSSRSSGAVHRSEGADRCRRYRALRLPGIRRRGFVEKTRRCARRRRPELCRAAIVTRMPPKSTLASLRPA